MMNTTRSLVVSHTTICSEQLADVLRSLDHDLLMLQSAHSIATQISKFKPDAVFLDLDTPGLHGLEVLKFLRRNTQEDETLYFVISSNDEQGLVIKALALGATDFIRKPFVKAELTLRISELIRNRRLKQDIAEQRKSLSTFFSKQIVDGITDGSIKPEVGGSTKLATVAYVKIEQMQILTESLEPCQLADLMSQIYSLTSTVVSQFGGSVINSRGDAFLATFGVPNNIDRPEESAARAATEIIRLVDGINWTRQSNGSTAIKIGIALASGNVYAGNIGSAKRLEYTILGKPVNLAQQLQEFGANMALKLIMDRATATAAKMDAIEAGAQFSGQPVFTLCGHSNHKQNSDTILFNSKTLTPKTEAAL